MIKILVVTLGLLLLLALSACQSAKYYSQAINGQYQILLDRQPISEMMTDTDTPVTLRNRLMFILKVREFAENELQLPVKNHYLTYVDLKRPFVVWNVFATPEFSLVPKTWCYPIVGCAAYRGFFSEENARQYADALKNRNYDVYVGGVTAYSTLGWFDDPVLSTFMRLSEARIAALIFHELAHQILYVAGDTAFNESFATAVEQEGLRKWQIASRNSQIYRDYLYDYRCQRLFIGLIMKYRRKLEFLYQTDLTPADKREKKASIFTELRKEYERIKAQQTDLAVYAGWMDQPLNNARIISVATYHDFVPAFQKMIAAHEGNLNQFYLACKNLAQKKKAERHHILKTYAEKQESVSVQSALLSLPGFADPGASVFNLDR